MSSILSPQQDWCRFTRSRFTETVQTLGQKPCSEELPLLIVQSIARPQQVGAKNLRTPMLHMLSIVCQNIRCEDKPLKVVSLLGPLRFRLSSFVDGGQDVDTNRIEPQRKSEVEHKSTRDVWVLRVQNCQISTHNRSVLGTTETFLAKPEGDAEPHMRRRKMNRHSLLRLGFRWEE